MEDLEDCFFLNIRAVYEDSAVLARWQSVFEENLALVVKLGTLGEPLYQVLNPVNPFFPQSLVHHAAA